MEYTLEVFILGFFARTEIRICSTKKMAATAANLFTPEDFSSFKESLRGVKDLVDSGIRELPRFYIRSDSRMRVQSSVLPPGGEVPIVDLRELDGSDRGRIVEAVARASEEWGFFQVINHGVEAATIHEMVEVAKEFFAMPVEDRMEIFSADLFKRTRFGTSHNPSQETSLEWKDYLRHPCLPLEESMQSWPTKPASYRRVASDYCRGVKGLADKLLEVLSESLGLERRYLGSVFGSERLQEMFCNYYPPCPNPELTIGIGEHSDVGGITVLLQNEVEGLEVRKDGHWYSIKPVKDAFVVNLGDQLQVPFFRHFLFWNFGGRCLTDFEQRAIQERGTPCQSQQRQASHLDSYVLSAVERSANSSHSGATGRGAPPGLQGGNFPGLLGRFFQAQAARQEMPRLLQDLIMGS
ncbi:2-oxoacid-dependent dioxygenase [Selaginella moellendorffii]|uniref:2-oxoacid-dependent dioxygenase n=1 Tax=Selaginella moellendorffii TaxID=88036 RepID=D8RT09_SELML|nr:2-oxoacid-dependent dioxygenase [Selaginella moellendorffii]